MSELLCCPSTFQSLRPLAAKDLEAINALIHDGRVRNTSENLVTEPLESGLLREDGLLLYPMRHGIPILLSGEAIPISKIMTFENGIS